MLDNQLTSNAAASPIPNEQNVPARSPLASLCLQPMTPIPTEYKGVQFRSRLEAQAAFLFDALQWEWAYEPKSYLLPNGVAFAPDFYIEHQRMFVECRGYSSQKADSQITQFGRDVVQGQAGPRGGAILRFAVIQEDSCECYRPGHERHDEGSLIAWCRLCGAWVHMGLGEAECPLCFNHGSSISHAFVLSCALGKILLNGVPSEFWDGMIFVPQTTELGGSV